MNKNTIKSMFELMVRIFFVLLLLTAVAQAQLSTSGPERPPGVDDGIRPPSRAQVIIPDVPYYIWHHGCGPTAIGMIIGYYDIKGCRHLVDGEASIQTTGVNAMMSEDHNNTNCSAPYSDHYHDYSCPRDNGSNILTDKSELGGTHVDNCIADFMKTSQSAYGLPYGWSYDSFVPIAFTDYINYVCPRYDISTNQRTFYDITWEEYKNEIDNLRPVGLLVDTDGDGMTDHFVTAVGYEEDGGTNYYCCHDTWDENNHWFQWRPMNVGAGWGIYSATTFTCGYTPRTFNVPGDFSTLQEAIEEAEYYDTLLIPDGIYTGDGFRDLILEGKPIIKSVNGPEFTIIDCQGSAGEPHRGISVEITPGTEVKIEGLTIRNGYSTTQGGGLYCLNTSLTLTNCVFENNYASMGGGLCIYNNSSPTITDCSFINNSATEGGGIYIDYFPNPTIENCLIKGNSADYGGGIYNRASAHTIQNTVIASNTADYGGGLYNYTFGGDFINCTFYGNSANNGGGMEIAYGSSTVQIDNSIISNSTHGYGIYCQNSQYVPTLSCSDIFGNAKGDWEGAIADQLTINNNFSANPSFCSADNDNFELFTQSPCAAANSPCGLLVGAFDVGCDFMCGDVARNGSIDILDVVYLINFKYKEGPAPDPMESGDVNSDETVNILDVVYLINYKYKSGPEPNCP